MTTHESTGLLLLGHGSHFNPESSVPVEEHAARLRASGEFAEVRTGYWKEEPPLCRSLDGFDTPDIVIVPVFMSGGYFVRQVIPRELELTGPVTHRAGRTLHYAAPVGGHPALAEVLIERARAGGADADSAVVVLGHGTTRDARSGRTVFERTADVEASGEFAEVCAMFIDQDPNITGVWEQVRADRVVVVPYFMASGWHVGETIPSDLLLESGAVTHGSRTLTMTEPVGTHPGIARVIREVAFEALVRHLPAP